VRYSVSVISFRQVKLKVISHGFDFLPVVIKDSTVGAVSTNSLSTAQVVPSCHIETINGNLPVVAAESERVEIVGVVFHTSNIAENWL